ncbi:Uncharacterized protein OBRU01_11590, partial [Operophtera brumata]
SETPVDSNPAGVGAELERRKRSQEAKQLIGASTANARAMFQQNLAQGQIASRSNSIPEKPARSSVIAQRINTFSQNPLPTSHPTPTSPIKSPIQLEPTTSEEPKTSPLKNIDKIKMSLETPSQIQYEPIIDPSVDLSPSTENEPISFSDINYSEYRQSEAYRDIEDLKQSEPMIKQNILENDMFDASYSSSNENDDEDSDNKFSTIKRSPYSKNNIAGENEKLSRQNTVIENVNYKKEQNGTTLDDVSSEAMDEDGAVYEDLDDDPGLTARALYDYQADVSPEAMDEDGAVYEDLDDDPGLTARALYDYQADVSPEAMEEDGAVYEDLDDDPGLTARALYDYQADVSPEAMDEDGAVYEDLDDDPGLMARALYDYQYQIDAGWWQGLGPRGLFGLFPANYVEILPAHPR